MRPDEGLSATRLGETGKLMQWTTVRSENGVMNNVAFAQHLGIGSTHIYLKRAPRSVCLDLFKFLFPTVSFKNVTFSCDRRKSC